MLDGSLYDLLQERSLNPLSVKEVRPIAQQLLVTLDALKGLGVLHTDIKPDNIMLVNKQDQPFRIKLIDFGEAISVADVQPGLVIQPIGYRAPEVALGLPFTEAVDVWGVGCVLAYLYLADDLFPFVCVYQMMKRIVEVLGQPEDHLLCAGKYTEYFFCQEEAADGPAWRLMTPDEFAEANDLILQEENSDADLPSSLDDLVNVYPRENADEFEDRTAFIDLLKQLLHLVGDQRISPHQALQHSFIAMSHLTEHPCSSDYLITSQTLMSFCPMEDRINTTAATTGSSSDEDPAARSEGELSNAIYDIEPSDCSSDEGIAD
ncbi:Homeodomain-interacting protein kinase 1, partial [Larimichthys crocea]